MKVEVNINDGVQNKFSWAETTNENLPSCEIAIDIGQVLAANQTLLKNMVKKIDGLENKMSFMEKSLIEYAQKAAAEKQMLSLLNSPAKRIIEPWKPQKKKSPAKTELNFFDKFFRPWTMRN